MDSRGKSSSVPPGPCPVLPCMFPGLFPSLCLFVHFVTNPRKAVGEFEKCYNTHGRQVIWIKVEEYLRPVELGSAITSSW